jgi:hypothetical protein
MTQQHDNKEENYQQQMPDSKELADEWAKVKSI